MLTNQNQEWVVSGTWLCINPPTAREQAVCCSTRRHFVHQFTRTRRRSALTSRFNNATVYIMVFWKMYLFYLRKKNKINKTGHFKLEWGLVRDKITPMILLGCSQKLCVFFLFVLSSLCLFGIYCFPKLHQQSFLCCRITIQAYITN